jgi:hypothetical protein
MADFCTHADLVTAVEAFPENGDDILRVLLGYKNEVPRTLIQSRQSDTFTEFLNQPFLISGDR